MPLILAASVIAQVASLPAFKDQLDWKRTMPMAAAGVVGIPLGVWLLDRLPAGAVKMAVGRGDRRLYRLRPAGAHQAAISRQAAGSPTARIGFAGGVLGGMIGLSGALPVIWSQFRGWSPEVARSIYQPFNTLILSIACGVQIAAGFFTEEVVWLVVYTAPVTLAGHLPGRETVPPDQRRDLPVDRAVVPAVRRDRAVDSGIAGSPGEPDRGVQERRSRAIAATSRTMAAMRTGPGFSFNTNTPMSAANRILLSLRAATTATGACTIAQMTMP